MPIPNPETSTCYEPDLAPFLFLCGLELRRGAVDPKNLRGGQIRDTQQVAADKGRRGFAHGLTLTAQETSS